MDFSRAFTWILLDIYSIFTGFREIFYQWPAPSNSDLSRELIFNRLNNPVEKKLQLQRPNHVLQRKGMFITNLFHILNGKIHYFSLYLKYEAKKS